MSGPKPEPGLVIRYSYLWAEEARTGREEGVKDRPCAVVLVVRKEDGKTRVAVLPITHAPPRDPAAAIELPAPTKRRLGLDGERSWVVISEYNTFYWPGPDLRMAPGKGPETAAYGPLPWRFTEFLIQKFAQRVREGRAPANDAHRVVRIRQINGAPRVDGASLVSDYGSMRLDQGRPCLKNVPSKTL